MNTTELKKLAEAAKESEGTKFSQGAWANYYEAANPAAILKLLQINAELVEVLKKIIAYPENWPASFTNQECWKRDAESARAALAKAEGGEL